MGKILLGGGFGVARDEKALYFFDLVDYFSKISSSKRYYQYIITIWSY